MTLDNTYCIGYRCPDSKTCRRYLPLSAETTIWRVDPAHDGVECPNYEDGGQEYYDRIDRGLCPKCNEVLTSDGRCRICRGCGWAACE